MIDLLRPEGEAGGLRAGLLLLVVLGVVGTAFALAFDRHWQSPWQIAPWITLGIISVAWIALVLRQTGATVWLARAVAVLAIAVAVIGVWRHTDANYNADTAAGHHADNSETTASEADDSDEEETKSSGGHHADEETNSGSGHHGDEDDTTATDASESEDEEATSTGPSVMDAMTGAVGRCRRRWRSCRSGWRWPSRRSGAVGREGRQG